MDIVCNTDIDNSNTYIVVTNMRIDMRDINEFKNKINEKLKNGEIRSTGHIFVILPDDENTKAITERISDILLSIFGKTRQYWVTTDRVKNVRTGEYLY